MPTKRKTLYLIDGHALAYRTYFALTGAGTDASRWSTKSGEPTAGTYGFTAVLLKIIQQDQPDYLAVSFDLGRTFRHERYPDYKGTREKMPDDLRRQIERINEIVAAFNIPIFTAEGYEADDVLGTVAKRAAAQGVNVKIITGDRDLLQLADKHITINLAGHKLSEAEDYGPDEVKAKYGLTPKVYIDFKALVGDKSDNIPGVSGVGEKTATELLQKYGSLDAIYAHLEEVPARFKNKLAAGKDAAYLSQELATIVTDVDVAFDLEACRTGGYDRNRVVELFRVLEFNSLLNKLPEGAAAAGSKPPAATAPSPAPIRKTEVGDQMGLFAGGSQPDAGEPVSLPPCVPATVAGPTQTTIVCTPEALAGLAQTLASAPAIAFDTETTSTDPMRAEIVGLSLSVKEGAAYYIPFNQTQIENPKSAIVEALRPALTSARIPKYGHNAKYDYTILARLGLVVAPVAFDTMVGEWLCDPGSHSLGLKRLAFTRLGIEMTEIVTLIGRGKKQITMDQVPVDQVAPYAAADADMTLRLVPLLQRELTEKGQARLLAELEMPLIPVLADMEMAGIALDSPYLAEISVELEAQLARLEKEIHTQVGYTFNINSTQQLSEALFGKLQLSPPDPRRARKTAAGKYSTAADVLEEMRGQHTVVDLVLEQRELSKLKSTYVDALPQAVNPVTGRIHTSFNQAGAVTGRLASSDPNLQNIPIRTDVGRRVRRAFVAAPGQALVSADYSQIELRIAAHFSKDPTLLQAFRDGEDIHTTTAAKVLNLLPAQITKDQRRQAKSINFGLLYGMGPFALSRQTGLTLAEAEDFVKNYFARFPGIKAYLDETKRMAAERGYVETLLGRRRYFPLLAQFTPTHDATSAVLRARAERDAINAPVQGTAADIIKLAMLRLPSALTAAQLQARLLLQVHDELVLECPTAEVEAVAAATRQIMENAFLLDIPLGVEVRSGQNWDEMKPVARR
jgi:DNA polymerase I